jgi:hypothetical protein
MTESGGQGKITKSVLMVLSSNQVQDFSLQALHDKLPVFLDSVLFSPPEGKAELSADAKHYFTVNKAVSYRKHLVVSMSPSLFQNKSCWAALSIVPIISYST